MTKKTGDAAAPARICPPWESVGNPPPPKRLAPPRKTPDVTDWLPTATAAVMSPRQSFQDAFELSRQIFQDARALEERLSPQLELYSAIVPEPTTAVSGCDLSDELADQAWFARLLVLLQGYDYGVSGEVGGGEAAAMPTAGVCEELVLAEIRGVRVTAGGGGIAADALHQAHQKSILDRDRFNGNSEELFASWIPSFKKVLSNQAEPAEALKFIIRDIRKFVNRTHGRYAYFKCDIAKEDIIIRGRVHGDQPAYIGFKAGVEVMVTLPSLPSQDEMTTQVYAVDLFALAFTVEYPKATRLPVMYLISPHVTSQAMLSSGSDGYNVWPTVPDGEGDTICVLQLWGLLQFSMIPRRPVVGTLCYRCVSWGYPVGGGVAVTQLFRQEELEESFRAQIVSL